MKINNFTKDLFLNELQKLILDQEYLPDFHDMLVEISFDDDYEHLTFEYEEYEYLIIRIMEYLDDVEYDVRTYNVEIMRSLHYVVTHDLLDEEYFSCIFNYELISDLYAKYKSKKMSLDDMSAQLNKVYDDTFALDILKLIEIFEEKIFKNLSN